jgi:hypothetical protein
MDDIEKRLKKAEADIQMLMRKLDETRRSLSQSPIIDEQLAFINQRGPRTAA